MRITSTQNPTVRYVRSLDRASVRRDEGAYVAEGVRLVSEAVQTGQHATLVLYSPELLERSTAGTSLLTHLPRWAETSFEVERHVLESASQTDTPAGVLAVLRLPAGGPFHIQRAARFGLLLDGIADPGNAGTILRTADALGVNYVATLPSSVDLFSPKVVRAGMGAHFRLPLYQHLSWTEVVTELDDVSLVATAAGEGDALPSFLWPSRSALVIGSEAHGLSAEVASVVHTRVHIPMRAGVESLNAAVAASIVMYVALSGSNSGGLSE